MKTTAERLTEIMSLRRLKQVDILRLAEPYCQKFLVKLNKSDLSQFVSGKVIPGQFKLKILSLALNVNEAWLMGYEDVPMEADPALCDPVSISTFDPSVIIETRKQHNFSPSDVSYRTGIPISLYNAIEQGRHTPDIYQIQSIAHVLYTTPTALLSYFGNFTDIDICNIPKVSSKILKEELKHLLLLLDRPDFEEVVSELLSSKDV